MNVPFDYDAIIIGAGAAGLMTAICAAERGRKVLLLEKGKKPGVKILMSGGTRCNITHDCDARGIVEAFGPNGKFLHSALAEFGPDDAVAFFEAEGVATKIEDTGKIFPVSDRAVDVLDALLRRLNRSGAELALLEPVTAVTSEADHSFVVQTAKRSLTCQSVVITTGGLSFPGCGTTGDGYGFAKQFGHTVTKTVPALVPLKLDAAWVKELMGVTLHVGLKVKEGNTVLAARAGSMLFAHFGLTGPAPLDVSRAVSGHASPRTLTLEIDFLPKETEALLDEFLQKESLASPKQLLAGILSRKLFRRICDQLLPLCGLSVDRTAAALSKVDRQKLVAAMKRLAVPLAGTLGF
ncbi:MAG: aminoacetone oxidase family FAD-binding enzyme, partial [Gemmataceae bacterium]